MTDYTPEALEASDTRQALEEAFIAIFGPEPPSEYDGRAWTRNEPDFSPAWTAYIGKRNRFRRFLDAEAWTDAALMLIGDDLPWGIMKNPKSKQIEAGVSAKPNGDGVYAVVADHPAIAIAQAALRAKEASDV